MQQQEIIKMVDFDGIQLKLASPDDIHNWSHGEVTRPETINYRTQRAEKDGLFCEKIFGPTKDWECYCGKYKKIRYKGMVCDKCGVEVTRASVRRERMGHIDLSSPVSHIWFLRGVPSRIGLFLNLSIQNLEKIIYFASFIITKVNEEVKQQTFEQIKQEFKSKKKQIEGDYNNQANQLREAAKGQEGKEKEIEERIVKLFKDKEQKVKDLELALTKAEKELKEIKPMRILSEMEYQDLSLKYGHIFEAGIGAEAIRKLLEKIDLDKLIKELEKETDKYSEAKYDKVIRRVKLAKNFKINKLRPEWMITTAVPIIPPDLRPMVALDGGRFATSDLNDLYRRVINRNNRLKQLIELNAPEVICRNEKRMLQEAVDALIDNSARHGKTVVASTGQKRMLKSLADMLKGKQGRFRQNLLGKRVDYSGRSVIVVGPKLRLHQCGLPKKMALELFKPFVMSRLIKDGYVYNVRSASRFIDSGRDEVWDMLEDIIKKSYVYLNRAPTLHRLGIQAFKPVLIEGKAIQIHPLVCTAFNADFDGDQMAVHVPLTEEAKWEAANIMLASKNLLGPATGNPIANPNQDMVWGAYYMTYIRDEDKIDQQKIKSYYDFKEVILAYISGIIDLQRPIRVAVKNQKFPKGTGMIITSPGRILFNEVLPDKIKFINECLDKKKLSKIIYNCLEEYETEKVAKILDKIKEVTFIYLTKSGLSTGMGDLPDIKEKDKLIEEAEKKVNEIESQFGAGLLTYDEKHIKVIETWNSTKDKVVDLAAKAINAESPFYTMVTSGARGAWGQLGQIIGMRGLQANPAGDIIELPVKSNFRDGIDVLEYFISTHGARKGLSDTALRTSNAGYLTRRLIDVSQDVVVSEKDCKDKEGQLITAKESKEMGKELVNRIIGRFTLEDIIDPKTKEIIVKKGNLVTKDLEERLTKLNLDQVRIRGVLNCKATRGVCQKCYGYDLGYNEQVELGTAVGIIAAQSIGEPGTQLTMRTFHTGGIAGVGDITQGLPRVEEIFEARVPLKKAIVSDVDATVSIEAVQRAVKDAYTGRTVTTEAGQRILRLRYNDIDEDKYKLNIPDGEAKVKKVDVKVKDGQEVKEGELLFVRTLENKTTEQVKAKRKGKAKVDKIKVTVEFMAEKVKEYVVPQGMGILVNDNELVYKGQQLTEGSLDLQQLFKLRGREATQDYIIKEIQHIYTSQGQRLHDKHIEVIARQLFSKVFIQDAGDTQFLPGEVVDRLEVEDANDLMEEKKKNKAVYRELLLGITKVSLATRSFLSAASFIETSRVLINAATTGKIDALEGLKENVIIGRLIPAGTGFEGYTKMKKELKREE